MPGKENRYITDVVAFHIEYLRGILDSLQRPRGRQRRPNKIRTTYHIYHIVKYLHCHFTRPPLIHPMGIPLIEI